MGKLFTSLNHTKGIETEREVNIRYEFCESDAGHGPQSVRCSGQGVLWGIMVLGVYITFKLLDIADLTVDGSFALGGCVCATLIVGRGMNPVAALFIATPAGMAAGFVTGILHTVFEIPSILAGILTQISLWSINLWIMGGSSNIPFSSPSPL